MKGRDGYVYILSNGSMPGLVKIGKSRRGGRHRAAEIYQTGVPTPFHMEYEVYTNDCDSLERYAHECLGDQRVNESREFFRTTVEDAVSTVAGLHLEEYGFQSINSDFSDIESDLGEVFAKSSYNSDEEYEKVFHCPEFFTRDCLRFLSQEAIDEAMGKCADWVKKNRSEVRSKDA